jgi:tetratricopeptide (TPR) repeat protein
MTLTLRSLVFAVAVAVAAAPLGTVPVARAQSGSKAGSKADDAATVRARKHFRRGENLFALGRFAEALDAYEAAFEAKPLPDFLFNVAQCHRNLGNYDEAIFSYRKYLKLAPDAHNRDAVEDLLEELEQTRDEQAAKARRDKLTPTPNKPDDDRGISPWWYVGGGAAVVAITIGAVVVLSSGADGTSIPDSDLGNLDFGK